MRLKTQLTRKVKSRANFPRFFENVRFHSRRERKHRAPRRLLKERKNVHFEEVERRGDVELGRGVRHLRYLSRPGHGRVFAVSGREQERLLRQAGLRCGLGRM